MAVVHVTTGNFEQEVLNSEKTVLVDFWAEWCGPCRMVAPVLDELSAERTDVKICKVNVDEETELATKYRIMSIPTLLVFKNGNIVEQSVGAKSKAAIIEML